MEMSNQLKFTTLKMILGKLVSTQEQIILAKNATPSKLSSRLIPNSLFAREFLKYAIVQSLKLLQQKKRNTLEFCISCNIH